MVQTRQDINTSKKQFRFKSRNKEGQIKVLSLKSDKDISDLSKSEKWQWESQNRVDL